ncbi:unnamed protein product [Blepharisma stoltei]|uniref:ENTH domain-containing protein n=1 Tax=Blepharisma stoltei TaxID=1481888 RepID=A0AAU9J6V4_9CILI|nr:unnamed protein product [Blepharisma stoltei]
MDSLKKAALNLRDRITKTPLERMVAEVCSDENYGTSNTLLHDIAEKTYNPEERAVIMRCTWEYLKSSPKEWRRIYKALNLAEYLLKFGSASCINEIRDEGFKIRLLQDFSYRENSEERGTGIRDKCKYINQLIADHRFLDEEREKAKKLWNKFSGSSSDGGRGYHTERSQGYNDEYNRGSYDPYPERRRQTENGQQQDQEYQPYGQSNYTEPDYREQGQDIAPTRNEQSNVDIFSAPAVKPAAHNRIASQPARIVPPPSGGNLFNNVTVKNTNSNFPEPAWNQPVQKPADIWGQPAVQKAPEAFNAFSQAPQKQENVLEAIWGETSNSAPSNTWTQPTSSQPSWNQPRQELFTPQNPQATSDPWGLPSHTKTPSQPLPFSSTLPSNPPSHSNIPQSISSSYSSQLPSFPNNPPAYSKPAETKPQNPLDNLWGNSKVPSTYNDSAWNGISIPSSQTPKTNSAWSTQNSSYTGSSIPADVWGNQAESIPQGGQGQSGTQSLKLNLNMQDSQGLTMSQLKANPRQMDFTSFQSAPVQPSRPVDLEAKLMNLDSLELGQPSLNNTQQKYNNYRSSRY